MNIYQANNLNFRDLLSKLGYEPVKVLKDGRDIWYLSPFRAEKKPSFHIRKGREYNWVWYDFGHDGTSTILDFIMQYKGTDKKGALAFLDTLYSNYNIQRAVSFSFPPQSSPQANLLNPKDEAFRDFELVRTLPIKSEAIFSYLESRKIPGRIASKYFRLVQYRHKDRPSQTPYFGFGMQNESGGWEVRSVSDKENEIFKTALIAKDISLIKGRDPSRREINVFEGMTDFVSLLAIFGANELKGDGLILHGLKLYGRAATYIRGQGYQRINTFLDNNTSGKETTERFINDFGHIVSNQSPSFAPYIDLNDALKEGINPIFVPNQRPPEP